ncbi:MAG TPA: hypothetical protein VLE72_00500 [Candidatus Saccharimonadales bacterium]|nr:hypothetical protein [Candidatus Saccharimonadales bacterium]
MVFAHSAASLNLWPYWPTYLAERFTSTNPEKVSCVRPRVHRPKLQASRSWLVKDHQQLPGQTLGGIRVGEVSLPEVHDQARQLVLDPEMSGNTFDVSTWNQAQAVRFGSNGSGRLAPHYYHAVMALYVCHGVLFEDFDGGPNAESGLGSFVAEVVRPAFEAVSQTFGVKPLIVRLPYTAGFLDYPGACAAVFDRFRE